MQELLTAFQDRPIFSFGCVLFGLGVLIFCFGKKFFLLRWIFGDRSMFGQIFTGGLFTAIGLVLILLFQNGQLF